MTSLALSIYLSASSTGVLFRTAGPRCALLFSLPPVHLTPEHLIRHRLDELSQPPHTSQEACAVWRFHMHPITHTNAASLHAGQLFAQLEYPAVVKAALLAHAQPISRLFAADNLGAPPCQAKTRAYNGAGPGAGQELGGCLRGGGGAQRLVKGRRARLRDADRVPGGERWRAIAVQAACRGGLKCILGAGLGEERT